MKASATSIIMKKMERAALERLLILILLYHDSKKIMRKRPNMMHT